MTATKIPRVRNQFTYAGMHVVLLRKFKDGLVAMQLVYKEGFGAVFYGDIGGLKKLAKSKWHGK